jgi:hypothetical protein
MMQLRAWQSECIAQALKSFERQLRIPANVNTHTG